MCWEARGWGACKPGKAGAGKREAGKPVALEGYGAGKLDDDSVFV